MDSALVLALNYAAERVPERSIKVPDSRVSDFENFVKCKCGNRVVGS